MCIIKAIFIGIGAILFETILCVGRIFNHIIQRVAALFSLLFLLSAVLAVIQNGVFTYMTGVSVLGFVLCLLVPFVFQLVLSGVEVLEEKLIL